MTEEQRSAVRRWLVAATWDVVRTGHLTAIAMGAEELAAYIRERS